MAPAALSRCTIRSSCIGMSCRNSGVPMVQGIAATAHRSFTAIGKPCIQPRLWHCASLRSQSSDWASRRSGSTRLTMALKRGFRRSIRSRQLSITSRHDTRRAWMALLRSEAIQSLGAPGNVDTRVTAPRVVRTRCNWCCAVCAPHSIPLRGRRASAAGPPVTFQCRRAASKPPPPAWSR